jgi:putative intracellular protease/amidase
MATEKLITAEEAAVAEKLLLDSDNFGNYWDEKTFDNEVVVDGTFTIAELEAIILLKRYHIQQQGS